MEEITDDAIHVHQLQASIKKISVSKEIEESCEVIADKDMVQLVLRNLISNAIKFTPEKGRIVISLKKEGAYCRVSVSDTGIGMDQETLKKIQENNYYSTSGTAKESGTGLGLMLSKDFLTRNGSSLHIESEIGTGSIFYFMLPMVLNWTNNFGNFVYFFALSY